VPRKSFQPRLIFATWAGACLYSGASERWSTQSGLVLGLLYLTWLKKLSVYKRSSLFVTERERNSFIAQECAKIALSPFHPLVGATVTRED
jgi:hypothetical protein